MKENSQKKNDLISLGEKEIKQNLSKKNINMDQMDTNINSDDKSIKTAYSIWQLFGKKIAKNKIVFFAQIIIIYILVIVSLINLTFYEKQKNSKLWVTLLSASVGYLLPNPTL